MLLQIHWILFSLLVLIEYSHGSNGRPIIGIMTEDVNHHIGNVFADTYLDSNYVKWLQMAGSRVVPILLNGTYDYYEEMFYSINGLLFPGGGAKLFSSRYATVGRIFHNLALQANRNGDYFPIWGTCLGFELLSVMTAGSDILSYSSGTVDVSLPLYYTPGASTSRLFRNMSASSFSSLGEYQLTSNFHVRCLTPTNFSKDPNLSKFYNILSTNFDVNGNEFVSTIEGQEFPFYGTQWHPEKNNFYWTDKSHVNHSEMAVHISQYFANFFVEECRKSSHRFPNEEEESLASINQHTPFFLGYPSWRVFYFFNYTSTHHEISHGPIEWNTTLLNDFFINSFESFQSSIIDCTNIGRIMMILFAFGMIASFIVGILFGRYVKYVKPREDDRAKLWTSYYNGREDMCM